MEKNILTEHLVLRPFSISDAASMFENVHSDPMTAAAADMPVFSDISQTVNYIQQRLDYYKRPRFYDWAVVLKESREAIGEINASYSSFENAADIGYVIGKGFRNRGYASEALASVISFLFEEGISIVYGACAEDNTASMRVMEKAGMVRTRDVPERIKKTEDHEDLLWFAVKRR